MSKFVKTERLVLRDLLIDDVEDVLEYYTRNKIFLNKWSQKRDDHFYTLDYQELSIRDDNELIKDGELVKFGVFLKEEKRMIGIIQFSQIIRGGFQSCFLSYSLDKDHLRLGYMYESLTASIEFMFNTMKIHRIEANIMPSNRPSLKLVKKIGFKKEGLAKKYLRINDKWEDHVHMVLLNDRTDTVYNGG